MNNNNGNGEKAMTTLTKAQRDAADKMSMLIKRTISRARAHESEIVAEESAIRDYWAAKGQE